MNFISKLFLFAIIIASFYLRLHGIFQNGIIGSDTFQYWDIAFLWKDGSFVLNNDLNDHFQFFRPVFYSLNTLSLILFGEHDYSLKLMLGLAETFNVIIVFFIGRIIFKDFVYSLLLTFTYACIPSGILLSQIELPHTYSVTFILLCIFFLFSSSEMPRGSGEHFNPTYLLFSGISCGLAATTHGSTTFFAPIVVLIIFLEYWLKSQQTYFKRFKRFFASAAIFSVGFFISYAIFGALVGYSYAFQAIMSESTIRGSEDLNRLTLLSKYLFEGPKRSVSLIALYAFWIAVLFHIGQFLKDREWKLVKHSSLILFIGFCLLFSIVFQSVFYPRIFLPLNILILITILSAIQQVFRYLPIWKSRIFAAICMLFIAYLTFQSGYEDILSHYRGSVVGGPRAAQNVLKGRVSRDNRLLVAPYIQRVHRPQFKHQLYFGENVSYLVECKNGSLGEFIRNNKIKFVFISEGLDATIPASTQERYSQIGICTGMNKSNYKVTKDIKRIHKFLKKNGALLLESIPKYGEVYELNN